MTDATIGLDIGTSSIKLVALRSHGRGHELVASGLSLNPIGKLLPDTPEERVQIMTAVQSLVRAAKLKTKKARVGLSESLVFTRVIQIPSLTDSELASAIRWEAEQHIPVPVTEVQLDYTVLTRPEGKKKQGEMDVLLVAAKRSTVATLLEVVEPVVDIVALDSGLLSATNAVTGSKDPPTLFLHMGATSSDLAVVLYGKISLTHSAPVAGQALTRAIEFELSLQTAQAEQYKRTYGLDAKLLEGRVRGALMGTFRTIIESARSTINSFESIHRGKTIQRVILSGGTSLLPGVSRELASSLGVSEIILATPFLGISPAPHVIVPTESSLYTVAVGLAKGGSGET